MLKRLAQILIRTYQLTLSSLIGRSCRYEPSCSYYTHEAMERFGFWAGGWMGLFRILRCNPLGYCGFDPVPETLPPAARWYKPWTYRAMADSAEKR
ncbi:membrane protein insertion efficiency factor YidD [Coralliovum pocilloporae]|uniref:membrane protein insertion efficiency factor YidD n=1 Tax=Coralliovum pocilloporae TaxID=3066369 RepID=UPI00330719F9